MVKKYKNKIEAFLQTPRGKRALNFAYSFGAAIVILGAMFKILHLPFGNVMLFIGMVTEAFVFVISAFDTPIRDYDWGKVFPVLNPGSTEESPDFSKLGSSVVVPQGNYEGSYIFPASQGGAAATPGATGSYEQSASAQYNAPASGTTHTPIASDDHVGQLSSVSDSVQKFAEATATLTKISESLQASYEHIINNSQNLSHSSAGYIQQMENLNRNIAGLNTIYEIQLKSISGQIDTLDHINDGLTRIKHMYDGSVPDSAVFKRETEKMTQQIKELNQVYGRLLQAMTVNMPLGGHDPYAQSSHSSINPISNP